MRKKADMGNAFVHFAIRAIQAATRVKQADKVVRVLLEHPEDLGRTRTGKDPASIWQLPEIRQFVGANPDFISVVGHQCQFEVDYSKPTRLLSNLPNIATFGRMGWQVFNGND